MRKKRFPPMVAFALIPPARVTGEEPRQIQIFPADRVLVHRRQRHGGFAPWKLVQRNRRD